MLDTFRPVPFASEMAISKSVAWLNEQLEMGNDRLLLMDCRPQELYESSHIESAINVAIPGIMLRRLQKGNLPLRALVASSEEDRERFARRCGTDTVVLYDEHSRDWNENTGGESVLGLLLKRLKDEGCKAFYLEGERDSMILCEGTGRARELHADSPGRGFSLSPLCLKGPRGLEGCDGEREGRTDGRTDKRTAVRTAPRSAERLRAVIPGTLSPAPQREISLNLHLGQSVCRQCGVFLFFPRLEEVGKQMSLCRLSSPRLAMIYVSIYICG